MKTLIEQLPYDKIKMNWNKNPIPMSKFLSFLTIDVMKSIKHPGADNGWTQYQDFTIGLIVRGGLVNTKDGLVDYLDSIQYGHNLQNRFNSFCNPFYLFNIMNDEGKKFFIEYYKSDIDKILDSKEAKIKQLEESVLSEKEDLERLNREYQSL